MTRVQVGACVAVVWALALNGVAEAGPPGTWTRITGPEHRSVNTEEPGLARTGDGVLHIANAERRTDAGLLWHRAISADAKTVVGPHQIAQLRTINPRVAMGRTQSGGLRVFFAGLDAAAGFDGFMLTSSSGADGTTWTPPAPASSTLTGGRSPVYVASGLDAAPAADGTPVVIWGDSSPGAAGTHAGFDPATPDTPLRPGENRCCIGNPVVALEPATGTVWAAWVNIIDDRVIEVGPLGGTPVAAPASAAAQLQTRLGLVGRGAGGVFLAYVTGTNPFSGSPALWRVGDPQPMVVPGQRGAQNVGLAPGPEGRLWMFWTRKKRIVATRTNPDATAVGALVSPRSPEGTTTLFRVVGEGSQGPLDVLGLFRRGGSDLAYWHQRLRPGLTLEASPGTVDAGGSLTFRVTDAGDPVAGAKVTLKLGGAESDGSTGSDGRVELSVPAKTKPGRYGARATRTGYAAAKRTVRVR